jgi:hypothetical protein
MRFHPLDGVFVPAFSLNTVASAGTGQGEKEPGAASPARLQPKVLLQSRLCGRPVVRTVQRGSERKPGGGALGIARPLLHPAGDHDFVAVANDGHRRHREVNVSPVDRASDDLSHAKVTLPI